MEERKARALSGVAVEVRRAFRTLGAIGQAMHAPDGLTGDMRALLTTMGDVSLRRFTDLASASGVDEERARSAAEALCARGLATPVSGGPATAEAYRLTERGVALAGEMRRLEQAVLREIASGLEHELVETLGPALRALNASLQNVHDRLG